MVDVFLAKEKFQDFLMLSVETHYVLMVSLYGRLHGLGYTKLTYLLHRWPGGHAGVLSPSSWLSLICQVQLWWKWFMLQESLRGWLTFSALLSGWARKPSYTASTNPDWMTHQLHQVVFVKRSVSAKAKELGYSSASHSCDFVNVILH